MMDVNINLFADIINMLIQSMIIRVFYKTCEQFQWHSQLAQSSNSSGVSRRTAAQN